MRKTASGFIQPSSFILLFIFHHPGQPDYVIAHDFQIGIQPQCPAEAFQGRDGILQFQIGLAHARGGDEMIGIDLQRLVAVADRFDQPAQREVGDRPLMPGLGEPRAPFDQLGGANDGFLEFLGGPSRNISANSWRSGSSPIRVQTERMPFSANVRTVRSSSKSDRPMVWLHM